MSYKEISVKDPDGNVWKLSLSVDPKKTNRYQFSFYLNEKEFNLAKLQSKMLADMTWDLIEHTLKKKIETTGTIHVKALYDGNGQETPTKPKKRAVSIKPTQDTAEVQRPKKRVKS